MLRNLLASTGLALFAVVGCEDHLLFAEPAGETQVVYLDGEADHCIVVAKRAPHAPAVPARPSSDPAIAQGG